jgi:hypothetical protein
VWNNIKDTISKVNLPKIGSSIWSAWNSPQVGNAIKTGNDVLGYVGNSVGQVGKDIVKNGKEAFAAPMATPSAKIIPTKIATAIKPTIMPTITPMQKKVTPTPIMTVPTSDLTNKIKQGFMNYGPSTPAAQYADSFAKAGQGLPDPLMPAVLALKETSGGHRLSHQNNYMNIGPEIDYPSVQSNLVGGEGKKGFVGVINSGMYDKYLKSGNLADFFSVYTPTYDKNGKQINDTLEKQISDYNLLRSYFTK